MSETITRASGYDSSSTRVFRCGVPMVLDSIADSIRLTARRMIGFSWSVTMSVISTVVF